MNINDLRDLVSGDDLGTYKDLKNIVGDVLSIQKAIKRDEQIRKAAKLNLIGYDPDFDNKNLNEDEKIVTRKVKKMIERKNS